MQRSRPPRGNSAQLADGRSYPIGQRPQSAGGQDVAEEGDRTTAPRGGATHAATERIQTAAESQTRHLEPDYHNEMSGERGRRRNKKQKLSEKLREKTKNTIVQELKVYSRIDGVSMATDQSTDINIKEKVWN